MQRLLAFVLISVIFCACFSMTSIFATSCEFELSTAQNITGYIDVTVSIKSNPGIASFLLKVNFDNKKLLPYSVMRGAVLPISGTFNNNLSGTDVSLLTYVQTYFVNGSSFSNITSDGVLYTIRFKIKDGADGRVVFYLDNNCDVINQSETDIPSISNTGRFPITEAPVEIMFSSTALSLTNNEWRGNVTGIMIEKVGVSPVVEENNAVILAAYDSSHKLICIQYKTLKSLSVTSGSPFTISNLIISAKDRQPIELKLFLWNSASQMKPLAESDTRIFTAPKRGVQ